MSKDRKAEEAEDRERMARIVERHQKAAGKKKTTSQPEDFSQAAAGTIAEATKE